MALEVQRSDDGTTVVFSLSGEFASEQAPAVRSAMYDAVTDASIEEVVVDLAGVTFIDSTGVGTLALTHRVGGDRCPVRVVNPSDSVRQVLDITGVLGMLTGA
ncbi:MAG TPA: STAS domain-containing protein [Micromonosporaceae bacterium]|jgi:anti-anti-sigma factor